MVDLLRLDDLFLLQDFDGIEAEVVFAPDCEDSEFDEWGWGSRHTKMNPSKTACAEGTLKEKVGETVGTLGTTLVRKRGLVWGTRIIYTLATFTTLASALG
jgi:hypothetical protein